MEIGINSVNNIFVKRTDQKINIDVVGDDNLTYSHSLLLSYNDRCKQLVLTIDGAISTEVRKVILGKNFKCRIAPVYGFSDRLALVYKDPISPPLRKVAGILVSRRLCTSNQVKSYNCLNECISNADDFSTLLSVGINTTPGSSLTKAGTFPLVCDPNFSPSDPALHILLTVMVLYDDPIYQTKIFLNRKQFKTRDSPAQST